VAPSSASSSPARCDVGRADFACGSGAVHLEGDLALNFVKLRCVIDVDLVSFAGTGRLVRRAAE
jgi:hypothetical protein